MTDEVDGQHQQTDIIVYITQSLKQDKRGTGCHCNQFVLEL